MKSLVQMAKTAMKLTLHHLGLFEYFLQIRRFIKMRPYRNTKRFTATLNHVTVQFSTEDEYSKTWFFPRYDGGRIHENVVTKILVEALQSAKCFVDIGAHLGWYTCIAAKHMPYGSVYGFEMDDLSFALLKRNITINRCTNVEVYNMAVSDSHGVVSYKRDTKRPNAGLRLRANTEDEKSVGLVSVNSVILDEFLKSKGIVPDVIKVDVEGAEMNVLMGMRQTLRNHKPILLLEIHPYKLHYFNTVTSSILSLLMENGYQVFKIESIRSQESEKRLELLLQDSVLEKNTMLYASAVGESGSNVA